MFRCHTNPMLTSKPMQAYVPSNMGMIAEMDQHGVYVKVLSNGQRGESEHFVPFSNIESIRLEPVAIELVTNDPDLVGAFTPEANMDVTIKRKPGRPVGS